MDRPRARSTRGLVIAGEPAGAAAGVRALAAGGNAVDAAVASALALAGVKGSAGTALLLLWHPENGASVWRTAAGGAQLPWLQAVQARFGQLDWDELSELDVAGQSTPVTLTAGVFTAQEQQGLTVIAPPVEGEAAQAGERVTAADGAGGIALLCWAEAGTSALPLLVLQAGVPVLAINAGSQADAARLSQSLLTRRLPPADLLSGVESATGLHAIALEPGPWLTGIARGERPAAVAALSGGPATMPEQINFFTAPI